MNKQKFKQTKVQTNKSSNKQKSMNKQKLKQTKILTNKNFKQQKIKVTKIQTRGHKTKVKTNSNFNKQQFKHRFKEV